MVDGEKNDPIWKPNELPVGKEIPLTIESAKPVAFGNNKYGEWNLWIVNVDNITVFDQNTKEKMEGFSGRAIVFPSEKLHEQFLQHTNGTKENTKITITKVFKENAKKQIYTAFETKLIKEGQTPPSNLSEMHYQYIKAFKELVDEKFFDSPSYEHFRNYAKTDAWGITDTTIIDKLWTVYQEQK